MEEIEYRLEQDCELRFQVGRKKPVYLTLDSGKAEFFGASLTPKKEYTFAPELSVSIYTWESCLLRIHGNAENTYSAKETPMGMYLNTHACLERLRQMADESFTDNHQVFGPITMVVGPGDVGKSTLCKVLLNYAVRQGRKPIFADVDIGQGKISIPGTIGAVVIDKPISIEEELLFETPVVYNFGHKSPSTNLKLYNTLVSKLADDVHKKMFSNKQIATSGVIINTCGWIKDKGYSLLTHAAKAFEVDVIVVLDHEKLYNDLSRDIPFGKVMFLPKSGGVIERSSKKRIRDRECRIHEYFYGRIKKNHPQTFEIPYDLLLVYKIEMSTDSKSHNQIKVISADINSKVKHSILALSAASNPDDLPTSNIFGYICIIDANDEKKELIVLSPLPGPMPEGLLILTDFTFSDSK